jgi:hypothetical protein
MFKAITESQWKWTRGPALLGALVGFLLPVASLQLARPAILQANMFVNLMQEFSVGYSILAAGAGLVIALTAWTHDHRGRHVYALSLPVPRWQYALMRFGAGGLFLLAPIGGVLAGSLVVAATGAIPEGLHAYPIALTLRFGFAAAVAYAIFFAIASSTAKTAGLVLGLIASVILVQVVLSMIAVRYDVVAWAGRLIFEVPGILSVFSGRWTLIDV